MKPSPHEQRVTERMQPGVYCRDGFLGTDRRPLGEILDTDRSAVEAMGFTHEQLAEELQKLLGRSMEACGGPVRPDEHLTVVFCEAMGRIPCPFGDGVFAKGEAELTDCRSGRTIHITPLSVHMIGAHGFYQGRGSHYRIDPAAVCRLLGLCDRDTGAAPGR